MGEFELLDEHEPLPQRMQRHAFDRLIMLSDGVFAIAMTLSALDLRPPAGWDGDPATLAHRLGPALSAYAIAFIVISAYWMGHRRLIATLRRVDGPVTILNLVLLGLVAMQPAAIRLLTDYGSHGAAARIYFSQIMVMGAVQTVLWAYAWIKGGLIDSSVRPPARWFTLVTILVTPVLGAWIGMSIGHVSNFGSAALIGVLAAAAFARRIAAKRLGLSDPWS